jgi:hypothetical protein
MQCTNYANQMHHILSFLSFIQSLQQQLNSPPLPMWHSIEPNSKAKQQPPVNLSIKKQTQEEFFTRVGREWNEKENKRHQRIWKTQADNKKQFAFLNTRKKNYYFGRGATATAAAVI